MNNETSYKFLYHLCYESCEGVKVPFYVGRTNNPKRREREHKSAWKNGTEDKYKFIRELESNEAPWFLEVIKQSDKEVINHDWERWWVIKYIRSGYKLKNMRHGDEDSVWLEAQVNNPKITSVADVRRDRKQREQMNSNNLIKETILSPENDKTCFIGVTRRDVVNQLNERTGWKNKQKVVKVGDKSFIIARDKNDGVCFLLVNDLEGMMDVPFITRGDNWKQAKRNAGRFIGDKLWTSSK